MRSTSIGSLPGPLAIGEGMVGYDYVASSGLSRDWLKQRLATEPAAAVLLVSPVEKRIAVEPNRAIYTLDNEAEAATGTLERITGAEDGQVVIVRTHHRDRVVGLVDGGEIVDDELAGQFLLPGGDVTVFDGDTLALQYNAALGRWIGHSLFRVAEVSAADPDIAADEHAAIIAALADHTTITQAARGIPDRADTTLSFDDGTRTFTITPVGASFDYYIAGKKYTVSAADSVVIADTSGPHWIYYDGATLSSVVNANHETVDDLIVNKVRIGIVYWNATDGVGHLVADERHGTVMSGASQEWKHDSIGAVWMLGLALSGYTLDTDSDAGVDFELTNGRFRDEDLEHDIVDGAPATQYAQQLNGGNAEIRIAYRNDVDGTWTQDAATTLPYKRFGAGRLAYNKDDGDGTWSQVEVTNNRFVLATLVATNDWQYPIKMVQGQAEYTDKKTAIEEANAEQVAWGTMITPEIVPLYRLVMETGDALGGTNKCKIVSVTDLRRLSITGGLAVPGEPHTLLNGNTHPDTLAGTVVRGDLMIANATPAWARAALGAAGTYPRSDGSDLVYSNEVATHLADTTDPHGAVMTVSAAIAFPYLAVPGAQFYATFSVAATATFYILNDDETNKADLDVDGDIIVDGTVDGRDVAADGVVLDAHVADTTDPHGASVTLTTPVIGDFTNAAHDHSNAAGGGSLAVAAHSHVMLDASVHTDSVAQGVTRGSLIVGNATPKWDELVVGAFRDYLRSDGTDASWSPLAIYDDPSPQLRAQLDCNGNSIKDGTSAYVTIADQLYVTGVLGVGNLPVSSVGLVVFPASGSVNTGIFGGITYTSTGTSAFGLNFQGVHARTAPASNQFAYGCYAIGENRGQAIANKDIKSYGLHGYAFNLNGQTQATADAFAYSVYARGAKAGPASVNAGNYYAYSLYVAAPDVVGGTPTSTQGWAAMFADDVQIFSDKKLILEGTALIKGDSYLLYDSAGVTIDFFLSGTEEMNIGVGVVNILNTLRVDGSVVIGASTPAAKLHVVNTATGYGWGPVAGTVAIFESAVSNRAFLSIVGKATAESELWFGDENSQNPGRVRYEHNNDRMEFWANAAERMSIDSGGAVDVIGDFTAGTIQADDGFTGSWVNNEGDTVTVVGGVITGVAA